MIETVLANSENLFKNKNFFNKNIFFYSV